MQQQNLCDKELHTYISVQCAWRTEGLLTFSLSRDSQLIQFFIECFFSKERTKSFYVNKNYKNKLFLLVAFLAAFLAGFVSSIRIILFSISIENNLYLFIFHRRPVAQFCSQKSLVRWF